MKYLYKLENGMYIITARPYTNTYLAKFKNDGDYLFVCLDKKGKVNYFLTDKISKKYPIIKIINTKNMEIEKIILQNKVEYNKEDIEYLTTLGDTLKKVIEI